MGTYTHQELNDFRQKVLKDEEVSEDELKAAISHLANLRQGVASSAPSTKTKSKPTKSKSKANEDAVNLLGDLL